MFPFVLSPYVHVVENRLIPDEVQYGIFHQLSGELFPFNQALESLLTDLKIASRVWIDAQGLKDRTDFLSQQIKQLIAKYFLIPEGSDSLVRFADQYVVRPVQNPAITYCASDGSILLVRTSMAQHVFSPKRDQLPEVIEETMPPVAAGIFLKADGNMTLQQVLAALQVGGDSNLFENASVREAIDFLTVPERQLIKFTTRRQDLMDPLSPCNTVPRNLYHSCSWKQIAEPGSASIIDFHVHGIEDALWEFDILEPTINHALRFASPALGGQDYGARFCWAALQPEVLPLLTRATALNVLEVGGGTGTFARSFIEQARRLPQTKGIDLTYQILELSPTLIESQKEVLAEYSPAVHHFQQDATHFDLSGQHFNLIIANEIVADFPTAPVQRAETAIANGRGGANRGQHWEGEGAADIAKYDLMVADAPASFQVNSGVFRFVEQAWKHLTPGGTLIVTEYGGEHIYPKLSFHLNHEEYSIHFGHVTGCARKVGFQCQLMTLREFLQIDDQVLMLDGKEERILCLNHLLARFGTRLPYAMISRDEFFDRYREMIERTQMAGVSFSPLRTGFHYGPSLNDFMALVMRKPQ
jgi:SAM-dependent methyltransferase